MSETELEQEQSEQETPATGVDTDDDEAAAEDDSSRESGEDEAEANAEAERAAELAAERQEAEQTQARDDADIEKRQKQLVRAADAYVKKVVDALGPNLDGAKPCPLCADFFPGFRFPIMPPDENLAAIRVAIGLEPGDNLPKDNYSRPCAACDGWGYTDSGSRVPGQSKLTCYDCSGRGWVPVGDERSSGSVTGENGHTAAPAPILQDHPSNDPPEVERLKQLGYVVVAPVQPIEVPTV